MPVLSREDAATGGAADDSNNVDEHLVGKANVKAAVSNFGCK